MKDEGRRGDGEKKPCSSFILHRSSILAVMLVLSAAGCAPDQRKTQLTQGYAALEAREYDEAISKADAFLSQHSAGPGTAEALYLRGRALEQRVAPNPAEARNNLQSARTAYIDALGQRPTPLLESYIRTSLANVAYFQDDYPTALKEWSDVYDKLQDGDVKAWVLYRIGLSQQRLGRFAEADQVFTSVEQSFPNTLPAQRAREKRGARAFSIQFATFLNSATADAAIATLRSQGVLATRQTDPRARSVVMAGPFATYQQAMTVRAAHLDKFPDAMILP